MRGKARACPGRPGSIDFDVFSQMTQTSTSSVAMIAFVATGALASLPKPVLGLFVNGSGVAMLEAIVGFSGVAIIDAILLFLRNGSEQ